MYICHDCDYTVEEIQTVKEFRQNQYGRMDGVECADYSCPRCGEVLEKAEACAGCGEYHLTLNVLDGLCPFCFAKKYNLEFALTDEETATVEINSFLASQFDTDEIETILCEKLRELPKAEMDAAAEKYYREVV
jgi:hypothetical protein